MGGNPNLPENFLWPSNGNKKLEFLCQIDLLNIEHEDEYLPRKGILYFFLSKSDNEFPEKKGLYKVIYLEDYPNSDAKLSITEHKKMFFFERLTFPSYQEYIMEQNNISDYESNIIDEIESEIFVSTNIVYDIEHQILGHPAAIQGTVRYWWATKYLQMDENLTRTKEEMIHIQEQEEHFILLLQINFYDPKISEFECFGDAVAYFGIHKNDLKNKNFENVVVVFQNT